MPAVSFIIPTFNRSAILSETLRSLCGAIRGASAEIVVVNNSKTAKVRVDSEMIRVLDNPGSGPASGRNFGAKHAAGELLVFLDDDILFSEDNLKRMLQLHAEHPDSAFNPDWRYSDEMMKRLAETSSGRYTLCVKLIDYRSWVPGLPWREHAVFAVPKLAGFCLAIPKKAFVRLGGFPENFKHLSLEDDDFSKRLLQGGVKLYIDSTQLVYHNELDRTGLAGRLNRLKAGAINKRRALELGMTEYRMDFSGFRFARSAFLSSLKPALLALAEAIPNSPCFDPIYRRLVDALIAAVVFEGYIRGDEGMIPGA